MAVRPDLSPAEKARDLTESLALKGKSVSSIKKQLKKNGLEHAISPFEIEQITLRTEALKGFLPHRPGTLLPRMIGTAAILMGLGAMWLGSHGPRVPGRYSPGGYGLIALVLGLVLILKPAASGQDR
jgi:hypothetical protein